MKSRVMVILCFFSLIAGGIIAFIALCSTQVWYWRLIFMAPMFVSGFAYIGNSYCPHCGRLGLRIDPFAENCGYCNHCGKLVEYK